MTYLIKKSSTPLELTIKFLVCLGLSYLLYFGFIKYYGALLFIGSANTVAFIFGMHIENPSNYLENITLISDNGLQNSITHEISHATFPLNKIFIDKIMGVVTNSAIIIALAMLLVRSLKTLLVVILISITIHFFSISAILTYFMFEVSPKSQILTSYLKAIGITQSHIDVSYVLSAISLYYLKFFTPLWLAYYTWNKDGHVMLKSLEFNKLKTIFLINRDYKE